MFSEGSIQEGGQTSSPASLGGRMQEDSLPCLTAAPLHSLGLTEGVLVTDGPETFLSPLYPASSVRNAS